MNFYYVDADKSTRKIKLKRKLKHFLYYVLWLDVYTYSKDFHICNGKTFFLPLRHSLILSKSDAQGEIGNAAVTV